MSIKQMSEVFKDTSLNPTRKLIMLVIADNANDSGVCFPSINTIKEKSCLSTGTVTDNIKWLCDNKYLFKKYRSRKKGGRSSNKYIIYPYKNREFLDEEDYLVFEDLYSQIPTDRVPLQIPTDRVGSGSQIPTDRVESEPSLIYSNHHFKKCIKKSIADKQQEKRFNALWNLYGRVGSKTQARKKYLSKRFTYTDKEIELAINRYLPTVKDKNFQKHFLTFLNSIEDFLEDFEENINNEYSYIPELKM